MRLLALSFLLAASLAAAQVAVTIDPALTKVTKVRYFSNPDGGAAPCLEVVGTLSTTRGDVVPHRQQACPRTGTEATRATAHENTAEAILNRGAGRDGGL